MNKKVIALLDEIKQSNDPKGFLQDAFADVAHDWFCEGWGLTEEETQKIVGLLIYTDPHKWLLQENN